MDEEGLREALRGVAPAAEAEFEAGGVRYEAVSVGPAGIGRPGRMELMVYDVRGDDGSRAEVAMVVATGMKGSFERGRFKGGCGS